MDFAHTKIHISDMLYYYDQRLSKSMMRICVEITILEYALDKVHDNKHSTNRIPSRSLIKYINCQIHCNIIVEYVVNSNIICFVKYVLWIDYFYLPILKCFKSVLATWINAYFGKKILSPRSNFFFLITRLRYKLNLGGDFFVPNEMKFSNQYK